ELGVLRQAVGAAQVAAVGDRDPQVGQAPAEGVDEARAALLSRIVARQGARPEGRSKGGGGGAADRVEAAHGSSGPARHPAEETPSAEPRWRRLGPPFQAREAAGFPRPPYRPVPPPLS